MSANSERDHKFKCIFFENTPTPFRQHLICVTFLVYIILLVKLSPSLASTPVYPLPSSDVHGVVQRARVMMQLKKSTSVKTVEGGTEIR